MGESICCHQSGTKFSVRYKKGHDSGVLGDPETAKYRELHHVQDESEGDRRDKRAGHNHNWQRRHEDSACGKRSRSAATNASLIAIFRRVKLMPYFSPFAQEAGRRPDQNPNFPRDANTTEFDRPASYAVPFQHSRRAPTQKLKVPPASEQWILLRFRRVLLRGGVETALL